MSGQNHKITSASKGSSGSHIHERRKVWLEAKVSGEINETPVRVGNGRIGGLYRQKGQ